MLRNPTSLDLAALIDPVLTRPITVNDNININFGTSAKASISSDGTDLIIEPDNVGSGLVKLGASSDKHIQLNKIGLGTTAISALNWIAFNQTVSTGRGALSFTLVYTGSGTLLANVASSLTHQGTGASGTIIGFNSSMAKNQDQSGTANYYAYKGTVAASSGQAVTQGVSNLYGLHVDNAGVGTGHTGGTVRQYGVFINSLGTFTGVTTYEKWGINSLEDIQVATDKKMIYEGDATTKGDTYHIYDSSATELQTWVNGVEVLNSTSALLTAVVPTSGFQFEVSKNSGATIGKRKRVNFIEGSNVTLTIADDAGNEEVDVTIAASGGGSGISLGLAIATSLGYLKV